MTALIGVTALLALTAASLRLISVQLQRREDERLARKAREAVLGEELLEAAYRDAYKGPRQERGAQARVLRGY